MRLTLPHNFGSQPTLLAQAMNIAKLRGMPMWLPSPTSCWTDFSGAPASEGSTVAVCLDARYGGQLGPELAPGNGTMDSSSGWSVGTGWTVNQGGSGVASISSSASTNALTGAVGTVGKLYAVTYTITAVSAQGFKAVAGTTTGTLRNAQGTYTEYLVCAGNSAIGVQAAAAGATGSIDNVSIKEVLGHNLTAVSTTQRMILRKNLNRSPLVSSTGETWTFSGTHIAGRAGIAWDSSGVPYLQCSGTASNYASTPSITANQITGDCTVITKFFATTWTPAANSGVLSKISGSTGEFSLYVTPSGKLQFGWFASGVQKGGTSSVAAPFTNGVAYWVKAVRQIGVKLQFFYSTDYNKSTGAGTWTQIGSDVANADAAPATSGNALMCGTWYSSGNQLSGGVYYAAVYANATGTGTPAALFDPTNVHRSTSYYLDGDGAQTWMDASSANGLLRNVAGGTLVVAQEELGTGSRNHVVVCTSAYNTERAGLRQNGPGNYTSAGRTLDADAQAASGSLPSTNLRMVGIARFNYATKAVDFRVNASSYPYSLVSQGNTSDTDSVGVSVGAIKTSASAASSYSNGPIHMAAIAPVYLTDAEKNVMMQFGKSLNGAVF